MQHFTCT